MSEIDRETCECTELHMDAIQRARSAMSSPEQVDKLAELFKVLSDPTRVRILQALHCQRLCVCDIAETLGMTQSAISHQLRILRQARLVRAGGRDAASSIPWTTTTSARCSNRAWNT